jgi:hypothetical protein
VSAAADQFLGLQKKQWSENINAWRAVGCKNFGKRNFSEPRRTPRMKQARNTCCAATAKQRLESASVSTAKRRTVTPRFLGAGARRNVMSQRRAVTREKLLVMLCL